MSAVSCEIDLEDVRENAVISRDFTKVLVVDDSKFDRHLVGQLLKSTDNVRVLFAPDGRKALDIVEREAPAVVLTDLIMPDMDGLELVHQVRALYPQISVILMTAHGSEDVAMQALRAGAANYIPKKYLVRDLDHTLRKVLTIAAQRHERRQILRCLVQRESILMLDNDPELIVPLITMLSEELEGIGSWDPTSLMQMCIALQEALTNALFHDNFEIGTELRCDDNRVLNARTDERAIQKPYRSRHVRVHARIDLEAARFLIADDGPGYDAAFLDKPIQSDELNGIDGRGMFLIRTFMDQVSFNRVGNELKMIKLRSVS
jgi:CheY-like chemotaxis protein